MSTSDHQASVPLPLLGKRLLLTRSSADNARWAEPLRALGAEVVALDCIRTELTQAGETLLDKLEAADWVVLASRKGAEAALAALKVLESRGSSPVELPRPKLACVGGATALAAKPLFGAPACTAPGGTMASLGTELAHLLADELPQTLLELAAEGGRQDLEAALRDSPHQVRRLELYRTRTAKSPLDPPPPLDDLTRGPVDLALFASPSALKGLLGLALVPHSLPCVSLGPTTTSALCDASLCPRAEAKSRDLTGIIDATCRALGISPAAFLN